MIFYNLNEETSLSDSLNLSNIELESADLLESNNYANSSFVNRIVDTVLADSFDLSNYILNNLNNIALNLHNNCIESTF